MNILDFIAIDSEIATGQRTSICEVGICLVRNGETAEARSWLVQPEGNRYNCWNVQCHGICPEDTKRAPSFAEAWQEMAEQYIGEGVLLVAHNAPFDRSCLEQAVQFYGLTLSELQRDCSLRRARQIYDYGYHTLVYLCEQLSILEGGHHRASDGVEMCVRLYLRELHNSYESYMSAPNSKLFEIESSLL